MGVLLNLAECSNALVNQAGMPENMRRFVEERTEPSDFQRQIEGLSAHVQTQAALIVQGAARAGRLDEAQAWLTTTSALTELDDFSHAIRLHVEPPQMLGIMTQAGPMIIMPYHAGQVASQRITHWEWYVDEKIGMEQEDLHYCNRVQQLARILCIGDEIRNALKQRSFAQRKFVQPIARRKWLFGGTRENPVPRQG